MGSTSCMGFCRCGFLLSHLFILSVSQLCFSSFLLSWRFSLPFSSHLSPFHSRFPSSSHSSFFPFPLLSPIYLSLPLPLSLISYNSPHKRHPRAPPTPAAQAKTSGWAAWETRRGTRRARHWVSIARGL
ncbi:hypothetical protein B0H13DRAFT_308661 [Mycena leptocephala]|nr:hypothetical protein B0H13DRAFT_308661 [Mycena leptocephala]